MMSNTRQPTAAAPRLLRLLLLLVPVVAARAAAAFAPLTTPISSSSSSSRGGTGRPQQQAPRSFALSAKKGGSKKRPQGFGAAAPPPATAQETKPTRQSVKGGDASTAATSTSSSTSSTTMNAGQRALAELRRQKAEERDDELRRVRALLDADRQVSEAAAGATIPEPVARRMGQRMLPFVGLPLFLGAGAFVAFWYLATYRNVELEPALVAASTIALLVSGLLGITYSLLSASWDPEREGSFWGWDEFQRNLDNVRDGLGRSRENAVLRDKLLSGPGGGDEVRTALADLERREAAAAAAAKKQQQQRSSLSSKLKDELES